MNLIYLKKETNLSLSNIIKKMNEKINHLLFSFMLELKLISANIYEFTT